MIFILAYQKRYEFHTTDNHTRNGTVITPVDSMVFIHGFHPWFSSMNLCERGILVCRPWQHIPNDSPITLVPKFQPIILSNQPIILKYSQSTTKKTSYI